MLSLTAFIVASSLVIGQTETKVAMPTELQQQIDKQFIGSWIFEGTYDNQKFSGTESWKWINGKSCLIIEGSLEMDGQRFQSTSLAGWESEKKSLVVTGFGGGDSWTTRWTEFSPGGWKGQISGVYQGKAYESPAKIEFVNDTVRYEDTTVGKPWVSVGRRPGSTEQTSADGVFKAFADIATGGTWVPMDDDGKNEEKYERILDGKFLLHTTKRTGEYPATASIVGIDPVTKQCTFWDFSAFGDVSTMTMERGADGHFVATLTRPDPNSNATMKFRIIVVNPDTVNIEMLECPVKGEAKTIFESTLKRKR